MISLLLGVQQKTLGRKGLFQPVLRPWTSGPMAWMPEGASGLLFPMGPESVASATPIPPQAELGAPSGSSAQGLFIAAYTTSLCVHCWLRAPRGRWRLGLKDACYREGALVWN